MTGLMVVLTKTPSRGEWVTTPSRAETAKTYLFLLLETELIPYLTSLPKVAIKIFWA